MRGIYGTVTAVNIYCSTGNGIMYHDKLKKIKNCPIGNYIRSSNNMETFGTIQVI